ncbi:MULTISPECIES: carboxylate--amine ligase [Halorussus]|uniref:carboxylate--amine ligase n=1 Tax=Halorussus TaxID=1070314 RepID=UPI00209F04EF|nr:carboxylate--amine ligase [Halorussus vallis]USZ77451.1 carboxylate--amine ligase [Halorussus vallis]
MAGKAGERESVLIPTGYDPAAYSCLRSLAERGIYTIVASENDDAPEFASRFCDETAVLPSPHDDLLAYKDALVGLTARPDVKTVIPIREEDAYVFAKYREAFEEHASLVTPDLETLERVHDRKQLFEAADRAGAPIPETRLLSGVDDWTPELIIKSRYNLLTDEWGGSGSPRRAEEVKTVKHLEPGETPDLDAVREEMKHEPIVQEFVPKDGEYMFGGIYDHGEPLATFQHRQIRGNSYTGGGGVYREAMYDPELEQVARDLLSELDWHGLACIEYMRDAETGEYKLTEINPRMWQSLPAAVRAGADFPHYYWLQATGQADEIDAGPHPGYEVGSSSHLLYGEVGHLLSVLRDESPHVERPSLVGTAWEILSSCYHRPNFDYLRADDPGPFVQGVGHMFSKR